MRDDVLARPGVRLNWRQTAPKQRTGRSGTSDLLRSFRVAPAGATLKPDTYPMHLGWRIQDGALGEMSSTLW